METKKHMKSPLEQSLQSLTSMINARKLMNGTLLVAHKENILCAEAFGFAELATERPLAVSTRFNLASVSKPITATAILLLAQTGKLKLEDDINQWIKTPYHGISIKNLLNHTSGLPDYMTLFEEHWDKTKVAHNSDVMDLLWQYQPKIDFQPNERLAYSNTGYVFLALIVEAVSESSFADFLHKEIFLPLNMRQSKSFNLHLNQGIPDDFALGYVPDICVGKATLPETLTETEIVYYLDGMQGDGSVISNVQDLHIFMQALLNGKLLDEKLLQEALTKTEPETATDFNYGYGWMIEEDEKHGKTIFHTGGWAGYSTLLKYYVEHDITLIMLRNMDVDFDTENVVEVAIEQVLFGQAYELPMKSTAVSQLITIPTENLHQFCGTYQNIDEAPENFMIEISLQDGALLIKMPDVQATKLYPKSPSQFMMRGSFMAFEFLVEAGKNILQVRDGSYQKKAIKVA